MRIKVEGGHALNGTYTPSGSANAAAACLAAALMTPHPVTLSNVPRTNNTAALLQLAHTLGAEITGGTGDTPHELISEQITKRQLTPAMTGGMVGGMLFVAPILARRGFLRLEVDFPLSRVRTHLEALRDLKQDVVTSHGAIEVNAVRWESADVLLSQASVTATGMVMMLAVALGRETIIRNAASEPHVQALGKLLTLMGASVDGLGSNTLTVYGQHELVGAHMAIPADHIEAAAAAGLIALSGGRGQVHGVPHDSLRMIARVYKRFGLNLDLDFNDVFVPRQEPFNLSNREEDVDASIESAPWPGFPSDLLPLATVIATQTHGTSLIHEKMFNNRLLFIDKLNAMGAQIVLCDPHRAIVVGRSPLTGIYMDTPDVRAGLALLGAALIADGTSTIDNAQSVGNVFEDAIGKIQRLGAKIHVD
ncbi:MAG: UDP-N-acetylglucosamine 1-carboxyvinyltransferase [Chloroflexi bacterium]|nr:UDP-N-acetylglucosamine 1-carboxyvinyltransferase [Chloroflexota bacterium]